MPLERGHVVEKLLGDHEIVGPARQRDARGVRFDVVDHAGETRPIGALPRVRDPGVRPLDGVDPA